MKEVLRVCMPWYVILCVCIIYERVYTISCMYTRPYIHILKNFFEGVTSEDTFATVIDLISKKGGNVLCPGLKPSFYEDKLTTIGYD